MIRGGGGIRRFIQPVDEENTVKVDYVEIACAETVHKGFLSIFPVFMEAIPLGYFYTCFAVIPNKIKDFICTFLRVT